MRTELARGPLFAAAISMATGVFLGNPPIILLGVVLLIGGLSAASVGANTPPGVSRAVSMERKNTEAGRLRAVVGEEVAVGWEVVGGDSLVVLYDDLPLQVELGRGTNLRIHDPAAGPMASGYKVRPTKRGALEVPPTVVFTLHPFGMWESESRPIGHAHTIEVEDSTAEVMRMRRLRARGRTTTPDEDRISQGVKTTDFREIRGYSMGDPLKIINWRATAKRSTAGRPELMVNEYEIEGKRAAWFFLDAARYMEVGTNRLNLLDFSSDAALGLVNYLSEHGFRIGGTIYNAADPIVFYPDTGRRQSMKVGEALAKLKPAAAPEGLSVAAERVKGFLAREKPVVFIISRVECAYESNVEGVRRIRGYASSRIARLAPIVWLSPGIAGTVEDTDDASGLALAILESDARRKARQLRRLGVTLLEWDPFSEPVGSTLMRGMQR